MTAVARVAAMTHKQLRQRVKFVRTFLHCLMAAWLTFKCEHHQKGQGILLKCEAKEGVSPKLSICANLKFFLLKKSCATHTDHLNTFGSFDVDTCAIVIVAGLVYITSSITHPPARQPCTMQLLGKLLENDYGESFAGIHARLRTWSRIYMHDAVTGRTT